MWRPILSPTAAIATFATTGLLFLPIGLVLAAVTNQVCASRTRLLGASRHSSGSERLYMWRPQVVEVESINYAAVCTTNPCYINLTVTEKMVRPSCIPCRPAWLTPTPPDPTPTPRHTAPPPHPP